MRAFLLTLLVSSPAFAAAPSTAVAPSLPRVRFTDTRLENGLRVIIAPDASAPVFGIAVTYDVGSRHERPGRTGFAHLFEHMMFQGSENVGKGEHFLLVLNNGGGMNGTTNEDRTNYFETLPKNQLELALFLEADRMRALNVNAASLENQRQAVKEERRLRIDNKPYGKSELEVDNLGYDNFAYKHPVIGSMRDLDAASLEDVREFFRIYYAPNNAVLTLAGDLDPAATLEKVRKHFGAIPSQPKPEAPDLTEEPHIGERRALVVDRLVRLPRVDIAYRIPPGNTGGQHAVQVLTTILGSGQSSRAYQRLVKEKELASSIEFYPDARIGPGMLYIQVTPRPGVKPEDAERDLYALLEEVKQQGVTERELDKARKLLRRRHIGMRQTALSTASSMGELTVKFSDPDLINTLYEKERAVTAAEVQEAARKFLVATERTVVTTLPEERLQ